MRMRIRIRKENVSEENLEAGEKDSKWKSKLLDESKVTQFEFGMISSVEVNK